MVAQGEAGKITLRSIHIYPVKSCGGIQVDQALLTPRGLRHDRRFMLVDTRGRFVSQRELPALARLRARLDGARLQLDMTGREECGSLRVPLEPDEGATRQVQVWNDEVNALDLGSPVRAWLRDTLDADLSLVFMPDLTRRQVDTDYAAQGDVVSFADGFPFLLTSCSSLRALQARVDTSGSAQQISMERFRANLVIDGAPAEAEERWQSIRIGGLRFEVRKPCTRCVITTRDQQSGHRAGPEPLRTLSGYRTWRGKPVFGQNLIGRDSGTLRAGHALVVESLAQPARTT